MLYLQNISYQHPNKELLFDHIHLSVQAHEQIALIGPNGAGKSTLLKIIAGTLPLLEGQIRTDTTPYYIPQVFGQFNDSSLAQALGVAKKLAALQAILEGDMSEANLDLLQDDWTIEERCYEALQQWQLTGVDLNQSMATLSGGQKTKVFLAGISIHQPDLVLLDEPSNHLDREGRMLLYRYIQNTDNALIVVSHDRTLLNLLDMTYELSKQGITVYGGNYDFYAEQKQMASAALEQDVKSKEKALRKAKEKERETKERQQKLDARGKKKQEKSGVARIMMNTLRNNAEQSTAKIKGVHTEKISSIAQELQELRSSLPDLDQMQFGFGTSSLHKGKILFTGTNINYAYKDQYIWIANLDLQITSGDRIAIAGNNGSGKTSLIRIITGQLEPQKGTVYRAENRWIYVDQDYSLINPKLKVHEQAQAFNDAALAEHEVKIRLNRFLFSKAYWDKPCSALSGGERMRLMLCCVTLSQQAPDMIILDEPTNNLDIDSMAMLTQAINVYKGTLIVVSHDARFLEDIKVGSFVQL